MSALTDPARLEALASTALLDTPPEADFDRITRLIRQLLQVDVSLISLVDASRQFFKSSSGLVELVGDCNGTPLSHSFCQHVVMQEAPVAVADARSNDLVRDNLAVRDLNVIAYLGVPIAAPDGQVIGSLCALQTSPREWTAEERQSLSDFAAVVENAIALRIETRKAILLADKNRILANEFNHRAKNLLAVVKSLVNLSSRESKTRDELIDVLTGRLDAYGLAHETVTGAIHFDLDALLHQLLAPYSGPERQIVMPGVKVSLTREQVTPVCLIIHELATNSVKHGALKHFKVPRVFWTVDATRAVLTWQEPQVSANGSEANATGQGGFGTKLLTASARHLGGDITRTFDGEHMVVRFPIIFPVAAQANGTSVREPAA